MTQAATPTGPLNAYKGTLLPIYEEVCGDRDTYFGVENEFSGYLEAQTEPPESIAHAFRGFLAYGQNCHEASYVKRTTRNVELLAGDLTRSFETTDSRTIYEPYRIFRGYYTDLLQNIYALTRAEFLEKAGDSEGAWRFDRSALMRIWRATNLAELLSSNILYQAAKRVFYLRDNNVEFRAVEQQIVRIRPMAETVLALSTGINPAAPYIMKTVMDLISQYQKAHDDLLDPLGWMTSLVSLLNNGQTAFTKGFKVVVKSTVPGGTLFHERPPLLFDAIERILFSAVRAGVPLEYSFGPYQASPTGYALVISSNRSLGGMRNDLVISSAVQLAGGAWDTPGVLTSMMTRPFQTLRGVSHKVVIPLFRSRPGPIPALPPLAPTTTPPGGRVVSGLMASGEAPPQGGVSPTDPTVMVNTNRFSRAAFMPTVLQTGSLMLAPKPMMTR